jgi:hypothetical protein
MTKMIDRAFVLMQALHTLAKSERRGGADIIPGG